jgi:hypothetical protein
MVPTFIKPLSFIHIVLPTTAPKEKAAYHYEYSKQFSRTPAHVSSLPMYWKTPIRYDLYQRTPVITPFIAQTTISPHSRIFIPSVPVFLLTGEYGWLLDNYPVSKIVYCGYCPCIMKRLSSLFWCWSIDILSNISGIMEASCS